MRIKKYVADSMPEALKLVKADLGPRAVILNTRTLKKDSALGILGKGQVEVTAAVDAARSAAARPKKPAKERKTEAPATRQASRAASRRGAGPARAPAPAPPQDAAWADRLSRQIEELQAALRTASAARPRATTGPVLPGALADLAGQMEAAGLDPALAKTILEAILLDPGEAGLADLAALQALAVRLLADRFEPAAPTRLGSGVRAVVALVGPAGSGKTTAAARIAAHFAEQQQAKAAFVAADTDRVGGLEQLRAYAGILDLPVDVVQTPDEMGDTIRARRDVDLILIDTAGAGPTAPGRIEHLGALLQEAGPSEIHLVLDAPTDFQQMRDTVSAYARIGADRLLLTKLDETGRLGAACSLAAQAGLPLSYTTDGRDVPGNLHPADPQGLCRTLFERRSYGPAG